MEEIIFTDHHTTAIHILYYPKSIVFNYIIITNVDETVNIILDVLTFAGFSVSSIS